MVIIKITKFKKGQRVLYEKAWKKFLRSKATIEKKSMKLKK